ncbi:MAG: TraR/DksA C4-type zinc finger protein [Patescibacteria group bacterium]|nr:TraR/DksA C4-type zinc finger protein [Patescibacteria group bacterium]
MSRNQAVEKLRQVLLKRRQALRKALAGELSELEALNRAASSDEVDFALDSAYDEMNAQLAELESRELAQIEKALERIEDGTYGICEITGKPIPMARLQALPYTTVRVEAQRELERMEAEGHGVADFSRILDAGDDELRVSFSDFEIV